MVWNPGSALYQACRSPGLFAEMALYGHIRLCQPQILKREAESTRAVMGGLAMGFSCWGYLEAGRDSRLWALRVRVHVEFVIYSGRFTCCVMADTFQGFGTHRLQHVGL